MSILIMQNMAFPTNLRRATVTTGTGAGQLSKPVLTNPAGDALNVSATAQNFDWNSVSGATKYRILVLEYGHTGDMVNDGMNSSCKDNITCFTATTTSSSYSGFNLKEGVKYYWLVWAGSSDGLEDSEPGADIFTTGTSVVDNKPPVLVSGSATPGSIASGEQVTFESTWDDPEKKSIVDVQVRFRKEGTTSWQTQTLDYISGYTFNGSYTINGEAGAYEYQFRASDADTPSGNRTNTTSWLSGGNFEVVETPKDEFEIVDFGIGLGLETASNSYEKMSFISMDRAVAEEENESASIDIKDQKNKHKTYRYDDIVFRRAFPLNLYIEHSGEWDEAEIQLMTEAWDTPATEDNDIVFADHKELTTEWRNLWFVEFIDNTDSYRTGVTFWLKKDMPIGKYRFRTRSGADKRWYYSEEFYVIFNPYAPGSFDSQYYIDSSYYDKEVYDPQYKMIESDIKSYLESEVIGYYKGGFNDKDNNLITPYTVNGYQYSKEVFGLIMNKVKYDLPKSRWRTSSAGIARYISRISHKKDNSDNLGIVRGNWDKKRPACPLSDSDMCKGPNDWVSVKDIATHHNATTAGRGIGAFWGQCYVFSYLSTSLLRSVGIPARPVTNIEDGIDRDGDGKIKNDLTVRGGDSSWNFHVWTELWIPHKNQYSAGKSAWVAIDGTVPGDNYRELLHYAGPAPIEQIKKQAKSDDDEWFDEQYFYTHVNSPFYEKDKDGNWTKRQRVSTGMYVYDPGTKSYIKRLQDYAGLGAWPLEAALKSEMSAKYSAVLAEDKQQVAITASFDKDIFYYRETLGATITIDNNSKNTEKVYYRVAVKDVTDFNGGAPQEPPLVYFSDNNVIEIRPNKITSIPITIPLSNYKGTGIFSIKVVAQKYSDTELTVLRDDCEVKGIDISSQYDNLINAGETFNYRVAVKNPLDISLSNVKVNILFPDDLVLTGESLFEINKLDPGESVIHNVQLAASGDGDYQILTIVDNDEIGHAVEESEVTVLGFPSLRSFISTESGELDKPMGITLKIHNDGGQPAQNVTATLKLPEKLFQGISVLPVTIDSILGYGSYEYKWTVTPNEQGNGLIVAEINHNQKTNVTGEIISVTETIDSDQDGISDAWETNHFGDLSHDATTDADNDGLNDLDEFQRGTDPNNTDSDYDGIPDGWEVLHGLDPLTNDSGADADEDGFSNLDEYEAGTDPQDATSMPIDCATTVPDDFTSIQAAADYIAITNFGGNVCVQPGTYTEPKLKLKDGVYLVALSDDPAATVIDGDGKDDVITFQGVRVGGVIGFTLRNSKKNGNAAAVNITGAKQMPLIARNIITDNKHGIRLQGNVMPLVINNTIADNQGDGIAAGGNSPATILNNIVVSNKGDGIVSKGKAIDELARNDVYDNKSGGYVGIAAGEGGISLDPRFAEGYQLASDSPCIGTGLTLAGEAVDMGAYGNSSVRLINETAAAMFTDTDADGIDDRWEQLFFGTLSAADENSDYDQDGYSDVQEYLNNQNHSVDPDGFSFDLTGANEPGGTGYREVTEESDMSFPTVIINFLLSREESTQP